MCALWVPGLGGIPTANSLVNGPLAAGGQVWSMAVSHVHNQMPASLLRRSASFPDIAVRLAQGKVPSL